MMNFSSPKRLLLLAALLMVAGACATAGTPAPAYDELAQSEPAAMSTADLPAYAQPQPMGFTGQTVVAEAEEASGEPAEISSESSSGAKPAKQASGSCTITLNNFSRWHVRVFVQGSYEGLVPPFKTSVVRVDVGDRELFGVAQVDDQKHMTWRSQVECQSSEKIGWELEE